jgi:hypothetical protein
MGGLTSQHFLPQVRPRAEGVAVRQRVLGVRQARSRSRAFARDRGNLDERARLAVAGRFEQLLGLFLQMLEAGALGQDGFRLGHGGSFRITPDVR